MWKLLTYDHDLMMNVADIWVKLLAAGYLQSSYHLQVFAGCRLISLSKHPKPGVLPICISNALLWLTGRGLLKKCQQYLANTSKSLAQTYYNWVEPFVEIHHFPLWRPWPSQILSQWHRHRNQQ